MVTAADVAALKQRLRPGMAASQARALVGDLVTLDADPAGDLAALNALALWALRRYAPVVAADPPDGLVLDVSGACHRYGGEQGLLNDLIARCAEGGVTAHAAMADTWGAAHALARFSAAPAHLAIPGHAGSVLADLPVRALRIDDETIAGLATLGVDTVGDVEALPRASLALRFGSELTRRLDQMFGRRAEPVEPVNAPALIQVKEVFAEPIGAPETLARYTLRLTDALCGMLESGSHGARTLDLRFQRIDRRTEVIRVSLARPVRDVKRLSRLLCDRLETIDPGLGVEAMILTAPAVEPLDWKPTAGDLTSQTVPDLSDLVDTLSNRIGPRRLYRLAPAQSDVPERSIRKLEPTAPPVADTWPSRWPRPSRLLDRPEVMDTVALLPDQPPVAFTWRGRRRRVRRADGPERIFGEWWRRDGEIDAVRDYFQLEDDTGERFWVFRRGDGERSSTGDLTWFVHGLFG